MAKHLFYGRKKRKTLWKKILFLLFFSVLLAGGYIAYTVFGDLDAVSSDESKPPKTVATH